MRDEPSDDPIHVSESLWAVLDALSRDDDIAALAALDSMRDQRVVHSALCSWWGLIGDVALSGRGLPCCPHCGSPLYETESEAVWWALVAEHERSGDPGYADFVAWLRGKCRPSLAAARVEYEEQGAAPTPPPTPPLGPPRSGLNRAERRQARRRRRSP